MEHKTFLGKYRVAEAEVALAAADPASAPLAAGPATGPLTTRLYRGEDIESGRDVTLEVTPAVALKNAVREELEAEAVAAQKINHTNIPALYDFGIQDDQLIYVTEYFDGTSAEEWVNAHGPMPTGAVLRIALQVIGAMGAASFHKISHHAINPGNVLLVPGQTPEGEWPLIKVLHFVGVAPTFASSDTAVASFDKTSHYASPEQLQHGKVDFRSEVYSLGATMWFLLTGAPPLIAPSGPLAMQPTTIGLAVDKLSGMPKKVRRLLAHMLSVDPAARPQDPLAFYRQVQDCVTQVDRRESMARRFGVPLASPANVVALPSRRRFPTKTIALAAAFLAVAAVIAVMLPPYLRHQRIRQAEEPIGVPIGVPETTAPAPPVTVQAPTIKPLPVQSETIAPTTVVQESPAPAVASESTPVVASAPIRSETPPQPPPANAKIEEQQTVVASNEPNNQRPAMEAPQPTETVHAEASEPKSNREPEVAAIPTARPVSPEVRRAEPAPPAEGPEEVSPTTEKKVASTTKAKKERTTKPKRQSDDEEMSRTRGADDTEGTNPALRPLPRGRTRAHFIGVTADGNWMFSLPSKKIVIVRPPPGG